MEIFDQVIYDGFKNSLNEEQIVMRWNAFIELKRKVKLEMIKQAKNIGQNYI